MEEGNKGITFKGICKTIWFRKWVALVVAVVVVLACALSINYVYNPRAKTCEVEFSLNLPGSDINAFYSYPDGKLFYYTDLTSAKTLEEVKASGDFENVNVEKMVKNDDIGITRSVTVTPLSTDGSVVYRETVYKISTKTRYFSDINEAKDFLVCVANYPTVYLQNMEIDYDVYLPLAKTALDDGRQVAAVNYLNSQLQFLSEEYDTLIKTYGKTFVVQGGKTLLTCQQEVSYQYSTEDTSLNVENAYQSVSALSYACRMTSKSVYAKATTVAFTQPNIITVDGGMGLSKIAILSVVLGLVIALVAAYVAGYIALKKKKANVETTLDATSDDQPAAVAEEIEKENKE